MSRSFRLQLSLLVGLVALAAVATVACVMAGSTASAPRAAWITGAVATAAAMLASWLAADRVGRTLRAMNDHLTRRERDLQRANEELEAQVAERSDELTRTQDALAQARRQVEDPDFRDAVTGLFDRRRAGQLIEEQLVQHRRHQRPFGVLRCDIDHLDRIRDEQGDGSRDLVLQAAALTIRNALRDSDTAARYGDEAFLVLLPETDSDGLALAAEKVRAAMAGLQLEGVERCTVSIGGAVTLVGSNQAAGLLRRVEEALQAARAAGGDRVMIAGQAGAAPQPGWLHPSSPGTPDEA